MCVYPRVLSAGNSIISLSFFRTKTETFPPNDHRLFVCLRITFLGTKAYISRAFTEKKCKRRRKLKLEKTRDEKEYIWWFCFVAEVKRRGKKALRALWKIVLMYPPLLLTYAGARGKNLILLSQQTHTKCCEAEFLLLKCLCIISKSEGDWWLPFLWRKHIMLKIFGELLRS